MAQIQKRPKKQQSQDDKKKKKKILIGVLCGVGAAALIAGVTIPLVMCSQPSQEIIVTFDDDGQDGVEISMQQKTVEKNSTFGELEAQVTATKTVGNDRYLFKHWYLKSDAEKKKIEGNYKITKSITVCPAFNADPIPEDDIIVSFTAAPGQEEGVTIDTPTVVIEGDATFASIRDGVTATKVTRDGEWQFQWWYKDGDAPTKRMNDDIVIGQTSEIKSITVHPYFLPPLAQYNVTISDGGDTTIDFHTTELTLTVVDGTTLEEALADSDIVPTKTVDGKEWTFRYWTLKLNSKDDPAWEVPQDFGIGSKITESITLYPYFEEPEEQWIEKTVSWEQVGYPAADVSKSFTLAPMRDGETSTSIIISNFILAYDNEEIESIPKLQDGEELIVQKPVPEPGSLYEEEGVDITARVLPQTESTSPEKINIEFTFSNLPTDLPVMYSTPLVFDVDLDLKFGDDTHTQETIKDISIEFADPWNAPVFGFTGPQVQVNQLVTKPGSKKFTIDHENTEIGHFTISRPLDTRGEKIEVNVISDNAENLTVESKVIPVNEKEATIDIAVSFKQIDGIFVQHKADFQLEFVTTFEGSGREAHQRLDNHFQLIFTPDSANPYNIVMDDTVVIDGDIGENTLFSQIENAEHPYFESDDYLTIRNITREGLTDPDEIDEQCPIYFTSPQEKTDEAIVGEENNQVALRGTDNAVNNLGYKIHFIDEDNIPEEISYYTVDLQIDFWRGNPEQGRWNAETGQPENVPEGVEHYDSIERQITFVLSPQKWINYTSADWAQYRSIIISMVAKNKSSGLYEQKLGTAWQLSNISKDSSGDIESYYVTSYNVKQDYLKMKSSDYEEFHFYISNMGAAKQYVANDTTKYIIVNADIDEEYPDTYDMIGYNHQDSQGHYYVEWVDEQKTVGSENVNLYWDWRQMGLGVKDLLGPSIALFKLNTSGFHTLVDREYQIYDETLKYRQPVLFEWAKQEGLDPLAEDEEQTNNGQVSNLFKTVPDDFSRDGFSYGYTGGFKSKIIPFGSRNEKTIYAKAVYWKDFVIPAQIGALAYFEPSGYWNCLEYYKELYKVGDLEEQVYHVCGAFTMTLSSVSKDDYFDEAGRGAMFLLRKYANDKTSLESPLIAGINSNAQSRWNWSTTFTPYFDVWQYGGQQLQNLLAYYQAGWGHE